MSKSDLEATFALQLRFDGAATELPIAAPGEKVCSRCGESKPVAEFGPKPSCKDGLRNMCKACACDLERQRREADPEAYREAARAAYRRNPEPYLRRAKQWAKENPEKRQVIARRYARKNMDKIIAYHKVWKKANPEAWREGKRRRQAVRKARKAEAGGEISPQKWQEIIDKANGKCMYCGAETDLQVDHFFPIARGGPTEAGNLIPICATCNIKKSDNPPRKWVKSAYGEDRLKVVLQFLKETRE